MKLQKIKIIEIKGNEAVLMYCLIHRAIAYKIDGILKATDTLKIRVNLNDDNKKIYPFIWDYKYGYDSVDNGDFVNLESIDLLDHTVKKALYVEINNFVEKTLNELKKEKKQNDNEESITLCKEDLKELTLYGYTCYKCGKDFKINRDDVTSCPLCEKGEGEPESDSMVLYTGEINYLAKEIG